VERVVGPVEEAAAGREAVIRALDALWNLEIPQDLVEGYGYPQLTEQAKRKILGENLLKLSGMDVQETRRRLNGAA
jgi:hypothetical protein